MTTQLAVDRAYALRSPRADADAAMALVNHLRLGCLGPVLATSTGQ